MYKVLLENGSFKAYDVIRDIKRDPHAYAVLQKRWLSVVEREWYVKPASEKLRDKKVADFITKQLQAIARYEEEEDKKGPPSLPYK